MRVVKVSRERNVWGGVLKFKGRDGGRFQFIAPHNGMSVKCDDATAGRWSLNSFAPAAPTSLSPRHFKWSFVFADSSQCPRDQRTGFIAHWAADEWSNMLYCHIIVRLLFNWEVTVLMSLYVVNYYYFLLHIFLISLASYNQSWCV